MDWISFFDAFFSQRAAELERILDAGGCREGWLQGEVFLYGRNVSIQTNASRRKHDLQCGLHPMIAEIKICGGDYAAKMRDYIENDVVKLAEAPDRCQRFMILVVDTRECSTTLGQWLSSYNPPHKARHERTVSASVLVRIWEVEASVVSNS